MKRATKKTTTIFILKEDLFTSRKEGEFIKVNLEETKNIVLKFIETGINLRKIVIATDEKEIDECFKKYESYNLKKRNVNYREKE